MFTLPNFNQNPITMKKLFTIFCLLLTIGFTAQQAQAQINFGIRGGVNFATLNDTDLDTEAHAGLVAGIFFEYPIDNSPIVIQPEILYSRKGYEVETVNGRESISLNYIEVPIFVKFNYILDNDLTPYVEAGPYVGFLVGTEPGDGEGINDVDFGVAVGAGLGYHCLNIGVRYSAGLVPIFEADNVSAKNGVFSIVAGVTIPPNFFD